MVISLRKAGMLVLLALVLLLGLLGWSMKMGTPPALPHHSSIHSSHTLAWYCPPPPRNC